MTDGHPPTRTFTGAEILKRIARGSEDVRAYTPSDTVYIGDAPGVEGDSWVFTNGEKHYNTELLWRFDLPFTEKTDPEKEYVCPQVVAFEGVATEYDDMNWRGGASHNTRCDQCGFHTQLDAFIVEAHCGKCRDR